MQPPKKIIFLSDQCEAELVLRQPTGTHKLDKGVFLYQYTKAIEGGNKPFPMALNQIEQLKSLNLLKTE